MKIQIYHNPRCGKSRAALQYLHQKGIDPDIILYLKKPPTIEELNNVICKLNIKPYDLIRKKEKVFIESFRNSAFSDSEWIQIMMEHPVLIERPLIITEEKAVIGRPAEKIDELL